MSALGLSPRANALAYRIWGYAHPLGWDVTLGQVAEALDADPRRVGRICAIKGWTSRLRSSLRESSVRGMIDNIDDFLEGA